MDHWNDPIGFLKGVTPSLRRAFEALEIRTFGEFLERMPRRYEDFSQQKTLFGCEDGESVTVRVTVKKITAAGGFRRVKIFRAIVEDASGSASAVFFNQPWLMKELTPGREILLSGLINVHAQYGRQITRPNWRPVPADGVPLGEILPVYATSRSIPQKTYRRLAGLILDERPWPQEDPLSAPYLPEGLPSFSEAIVELHKPASMKEVERARRRFAFNEALLYRLGFRLSDQDIRRSGGVAMPFQESFARQFAESFPFPLTGDQKRAVWVALQDMEKDVPMRRLLQGDVGSGKTAVPAFLAAHVYKAGSSTAFLAPTDILAVQHSHTLRRLFAKHRIPLLLLTRTKKFAWFGQQEEELSVAQADRYARQGGVVIIGTHALLQEKRIPADLGLVIVDEQHRFGVEQRQFLAEATRADGKLPHLFSMTATPIPRSLALTVFGDLDVSSLHEKPGGRKPIASEVCVGERREKAYQAIREAASRKEASFVVCPLIDPSDAMGKASVQETQARLQNGPLSGLRIGVLHGRMKPEEKEEVMQKILARELDVLIATTVIEVGVDVPHATVMAIESAERFGMAQLHQLRGRVGRSDLASRCYFLTDTDGEASERLDRVATLQDGFELAEEDFKRRGAGNMFGTAQSGYMAFNAIKWQDLDLLKEATVVSQRLLEDDPGLEGHAWLREQVLKLREAAHLE